MTIHWETLKTATQLMAEKVTMLCEQLNVERDRLTAAGVQFGGHTYQTRDKDIADLLGALQMAQLASAGGQPFTTKWLTVDNVQIEMNLNDLAALGAVVAQHKTHLVYKCREHKDALMALETWPEVEAYMANLTW